MTQPVRTRQDFYNRWRQYLHDSHSFWQAFLTNENSRHHLRVGMGTEHEAELCANYTAGRQERLLGCLEAALLEHFVAEWVGGTGNLGPLAYHGAAISIPHRVAENIGFSLSLAKEREVVAWTVAHSGKFFANPQDFDDAAVAYANELNDITVTWRSGNGTIQIGTDQPFNMVNRETARFDHTETIRLTNITPADNSPSTFVLAFDVPTSLQVQAKMVMWARTFPVSANTPVLASQTLRNGNDLSTASYFAFAETLLTEAPGEVADREFSHISIVFEALPEEDDD